MSIFQRIRRVFSQRRLKTERRSSDAYSGIGWSDWYSHDGFWPSEFGAKQNLKIAAVWRCVNIIAGTMAGLEWRVVERLDEGKTKQNWDHPLRRLLNEKINDEYTPNDFWMSLIAWRLLTGNGYAEIVRDGAGRPVQLYVIEPERVQPTRDENGVLIYRVSQSDGGTIDVTSRNIFHVRGLGPTGAAGYSLSEAGAETFKINTVIERWSGNYFAKAMAPSGVISIKRDDPLTPEEMFGIQSMFTKSMSGPDSAVKPFIATEGVEYQAITHAPEQAQFLETRRFMVTEVARFFGVPPSMLFARDAQVRSDTEDMTREFRNVTLKPIAESLEQEVNTKLIGQPNRYRCHLDFRSLLRADTATRAEYYTKMRAAGLMTINECRQMEGLDPVDSRGDHLTAQVQYQPIGPDGAASAPKSGTPGDAGESGSTDEEEDDTENEDQNDEENDQPANTTAAET